MPRFTIVPTDNSPQISASKALSVFHRVSRLKCGEADVLEDGEYAFTVRISRTGFWSIYQRNKADLPVPSDALV